MTDTARHQITRVRREPRRRRLTVARVEHLSEAMLRVWLEGEDLHDFESAGADDHVKLFVADGEERAMRDYTPRLFDPAARTLAIDFALHGEDGDVGPATRWAMAAKAGDVLEVGGPRGSTIVPDDFDWYLLIGDETAVPAIGRRMEELPASRPVIAIVSAAAGVERPPLPERRGATIVWADRPMGAQGGDELVDGLRGIVLPPGEGFAWVGAEASAARAARAFLLGERDHPAAWLKASGYWLAGAGGEHVKLGD